MARGNSVIKDCFRQKLQTVGHIYIISAAMKDFKLKKYAVPEVLLLAILVVGLIISQSIVLSRSYIKLSAPYEVPASGFFFSMPTGAGWQTGGALKFAQNSWYLTSAQGGEVKNTTSLTVSYLLAAGEPDVNDWLGSKADQLGQNLGSGRIIKGKDIVTYAAIIDLRGKPLNIFYGIAPLPGGRNVIIELVDTADDPERGWEILTKIAQSFVFKGNPLLDEGDKLVASLRSKGLGSVLGVSKQANYFLISEKDSTEGFEADIYARTDGQAAENVRAVNSYFLRNLGGEESVLHTNDRFDRFLWTSSLLGSSGAKRGEIEMRLGDGAMSIMQRGHLVGKYVPGPAAVPESFSIAVFRQMIADGMKQALIDFISSEGQIKPGLVRLQDKPADSNSEASHIISIKYFADDDISEEIQLDAEGQIVSDTLSGRLSYVLRRSSKEIILSEFPQWLEYINNFDKLLENSSTGGKIDLRRVVRNVRANI
jgi:hypothetical protein